MEELLDMIISDESPSDISDKIKEILYSKSSEKIDELRPAVSSTLFGQEDESEDEFDDESYEEDAE
jgi:hypothetical protein